MDSPHEDLNDTLNYTAIFNSLTDLQKLRLKDIKSEVGVRCVLRMWYRSRTSLLTPGSFCGAIWDNVYCWPSAMSGTVSTSLCSDILQELHPDFASQIGGSAQKICLENGTWAKENETIYGECLTSLETFLKKKEEDSEYAPVSQYLLFVGSILSFLCLGILLAVFRQYGLFRFDRIALQAHLMVSLALRFLVMLIITEPLVLGLAINYRDVEILCESVLVLFLYSTFTSTSWMFIQGLYLNVTLMSPGGSITSSNKLVVYYIIGWAVPAAFIIAYVIAMVSKQQEKCWEGYSEMNEKWILLGPIIFELVVNGVFLLNILRILMRKVRDSKSRPDSSQLKAAAKATLVLFPVLGINNLLLLYNPGGEYKKYFVTLSSFFGSTQGIFVAIVYSFTNKEVFASIQRSMKRVQWRRGKNFGSVKLNTRSHIQIAIDTNSKSEKDDV